MPTKNSLILLSLSLEFGLARALLAGGVVSVFDLPLLLVDLFYLFEDGCQTHCYYYLIFYRSSIPDRVYVKSDKIQLPS